MDTGIEVTYAFNDSQKLFGKVFHAMHLDAVGQQVWKTMHFVFTLDGVTTEVPAEVKHVLPCGPGEHTLTVAVQNTWFFRAPLDQAMTRATLKLTVEPGQLTRVTYRQNNLETPLLTDGANSTLTLT